MFVAVVFAIVFALVLALAIVFALAVVHCPCVDTKSSAICAGSESGVSLPLLLYTQAVPHFMRCSLELLGSLDFPGLALPFPLYLDTPFGLGGTGTG